MNLRNWLFGTVIPEKFLKKMVMSRVAGKGVALMYHEVLPDDEGPAAWTVVRYTDFQRQMFFLKSYFDVITIDEALARVSSTREYKRPFAVITFDDGYKGNLTCVSPLIEKMQIPVTIFVSTLAAESGGVYWYDRLISLFHNYGELKINLASYKLGTFRVWRSGDEKKNWALMQQLLSALKILTPQTREKVVEELIEDMGKVPESLKMMNVENLKKLSESSFVTIGGHSHCHNILPQLADADLIDSITINREKLIDWTGQDVAHFAYPNGGFDARVIAAVKQAGYRSAVTTKGKHWCNNMDFFELPRYGVGRFDSFGLFLAKFAHLA